MSVNRSNPNFASSLKSDFKQNNESAKFYSHFVLDPRAELGDGGREAGGQGGGAEGGAGGARPPHLAAGAAGQQPQGGGPGAQVRIFLKS
jgi:hypothetical protein